MARPPKDPKLRKDADLRIPLTAEQKKLVMDAAALEGEDMAAWVRPILLDAARRVAKKKRSGDDQQTEDSE
jgi:uncharacterized protein (DUF1778 family)